MALNIKPHERSDENEIANLIFWNIPWLKGISALLFLTAIQHTVLQFKNAFSVSLSVIFLMTSLNLVSLFRSETRYITTEKESDLAETLSNLGLFWKVYCLVLVLSVCTLVDLSKAGTATFVLPVLLALYVFLSIRFEKKRYLGVLDLRSCISKFAITNLRRVRFATFFSLMAGLSLLLLYIVSFFIKIPISDTKCLMWSASYFGIGTGAGLYWRKVRDIHRNPSTIYFERSLERLNMYWLIFAVFSLVQSIANFF